MSLNPEKPKRPSSLVLAGGAGLLLLTNGCAVHYSGRAGGTEQLWGLGRVAWHKHVEPNGWVTLRTGLLAPGLAVGVRPGFLGVALGGTMLETVQVVSATEAAQMRATVNGKELASATPGRWAVGRISLSTPTGRRRVLVTGHALAGLKLAVEGGRPSFSCGLRSSQATEVSEPDAFWAMEQLSLGWPHFHFYDARIQFSTNLTHLPLND